MTALRAGTIIDGYKLLTHVNSGAIAEVWRVEHLDTKKTYAMKVVAATTGLEEESLARMRLNFLEVQQAEHDHLLPVVSFGEFDHRPYAVLPLCSGDLSQEIRHRSMALIKARGFESDFEPIHTEAELSVIMAEVAAALDYVHQHMQKTHLDVKPSNILFTREGEGYHYYLSDFDIADDVKQEVIKRTQRKGENDVVKVTEGPAGSVFYMGPEQNEPGYNSRTESDIFAFGVSLYELAMGKHPGGGSMGLGKDMFHYGDRVVIPDLPATHFSAPFNFLVKSCLEPNPKDRPTAAFLRSSAQYFQQQGVWPSGPATPSGRFIPPAALEVTTSKQRWWPYVAALLLLFGLTGGGLYAYQQITLAKLPALLRQDGTMKISQALRLLDQARLIGLPEDAEKLRNELNKIDKGLLAQVSELNRLTDQNTMNFRDKASQKWGTYRIFCGRIIEPRFDGMTDFRHHYATVMKGDTVGFIDLHGTELFYDKGKDPIVTDNQSGLVNGQSVELPPVKNAAGCASK